MTWLGRFEELVWAAGFAALVAWMFAWSARRLRMALQSHGWPRARGRVLQSGESYARPTYDAPRFLGATVLYEYRVRGRHYVGMDVRFTAFYVPGHFRSLRRYPPGTRVEVYYLPGDPRRAVLEPGATVDGWVEAVAYGILSVAGIAWVAWELAQLAGAVPG